MFQLPSPGGFKAPEGEWMHSGSHVSVHSALVVQRDLGLLRGAQVTHRSTCRGISVWLNLNFWS